MLVKLGHSKNFVSIYMEILEYVMLAPIPHSAGCGIWRQLLKDYLGMYIT